LLRGAEASIDAGLPLYRPDDHKHHALLYGGHDPGVCGHGVRAWIGALLGRLDRAQSDAVAALALARRLGHHGSLAHAFALAAEAYYVRRDVTAVCETAAEMLPFVADHGSAVALANAKLLQGWGLIAAGRVEEGLGYLNDGLTAWRQTGSRLFAPFRLSRAADSLPLAGATDQAITILGEAAAIAAETGEHWSESEIDRLYGMAKLRGSDIAADRDEAEGLLDRALAGARQSGARLTELRAATSLARSWRERGRRVKARELLAPVYEWFTEGFDTPDLKEAKALLKNALLTRA
jgi:predicted ATPase